MSRGCSAIRFNACIGLVAVALLGGSHVLAAPSADKLGPATGPIRQRYVVSDERVGKAQGFNTHGEQGWSALLTSPKLGPIMISIFLPVHDGALASTAPFLRDADEMVDRVRQLHWMVRLFMRFPQNRPVLFYFNDHSVSAPTKAEILTRMRATKKVHDEDAFVSQLDRAVALQLGSGIFIVLPDGNSFVFANGAGLQDATVGGLVDTDGNPVY